LVVSGDGSERLPKLKPEAIGRYGLNPNKSAVNTVTSVELLRYIHGEYPGTFTLGVAFNPYENREHELEKMRRKMDAGASYIITQPIVLSPPYGSRKWAGEVLASMSALRQLPGADKMGLMIEAWMMKELKLIPSCVGFALEGIPNAEDIKRANLDPAQHDAIETLKDIYQRFGMATEYKAGIYLAALGEKPEFFLPKVDKAIAALQAQNGILQ
jgi:methylenetetrahydrofolate reductase (NADPH)